MENPANPPTSLNDLKPGMPLSGRVTRIELSGALVDVGLGTEGLLHISRLKQQRVNRVDEVVQVGQQVEAWVERVEPALKRLELTLIQPLRHPWRQLKPGLRTTGTVVGLERYGAFVDIGAERAGLVHISEMGEDYVARPEDVAKVGATVEVVVLEADPRKKQIRLSMKAAQAADSVEEPEEETPLATEMEIALRRAMEASAMDAERRREKPARGARGVRGVQDDLLTRTLQQKQKTTSGQ